MVNTYEASYQSHWDSLSPGFREGMMNGIVGFEMIITRLEGKYKLSQNKSQRDQKNVAESLLEHPDPMVRNVGEAIQHNLSEG